MAHGGDNTLRAEWPTGLIWLTFAAMSLIGDALKPDIIGSGASWIMLGVIFAIMLGTVFRVVHHAECLAIIFGEPFGTLILTLSVIGIEVALITAVMLNGDNNPTLARDTMFSVLMIVMNGLVGLSLLIGGLRHGLQVFNLSGANAYLVVLLPIALTSLVLPSFTTSAEGGGLSPLQAGFQVVMSLVLYCIFLAYQTLGKPEIFRQPADEIPTTAGSSIHNLETKSIGYHVAGLLLAMLPIVLLSKMLAVYVDFKIAELGAPVALGGFLVAAMILTPEALAALDSARANQLQRAVNICLGSAVATIGLTVPAVLVASTMFGLPIELGLEPAEIVLLALTLAISIVTFVGTRTNSLQGVVHLAAFFTFVVLIFDT
ncbi:MULTISPECIES: calcium:proton antiporter [Roseobacteraceae]|jgi:Ca2+:H+ antiporter|uniref:Calcium/proton antiporter n=1 Tax=Ruegeria atlantica TaxID=81569 RepID=A0A0P1E2X1_9RHOB|nr:MULTISPECIES: calcium:proton antiporter [Roseobacteraceae]CUH41241.1 Calcium/proton antiporter [Ruegeria atlantica]